MRARLASSAVHECERSPPLRSGGLFGRVSPRGRRPNVALVAGAARQFEMIACLPTSRVKRRGRLPGHRRVCHWVWRRGLIRSQCPGATTGWTVSGSN